VVETVKHGFLTGGKFPTSGKFHPCNGKFLFGAGKNGLNITPISKEVNLTI